MIYTTVKEKEADTSKKGDIETAEPSSSGRFSPRTRRLLNALEHNTNPRRTLPNRTILPKYVVFFYHLLMLRVRYVW